MTNAKDNSHKKVVKTKEKVSHETKMEEVQKKIEREKAEQRKQWHELINKPQGYKEKEEKKDDK